MTNKKGKVKWKNVLLVLFLFIGIALTAFSISNLLIKNIENKKTVDTLDMINKKIKKKEVIDSEDTQIIENNKDEEKEESLYYKYIKMNMIDVDLNELKSINSEVVGWISVNGTNVNYPFVQTTNNTYYLNHSFDKSKNSAGWVFLDYRNNIEGMDKNTIIYAHGRNGNTMFGTLKNIFKSSWLNNSDNFIVKTSTQNFNTIWQVFSVYHIKTTSDYLQTNFIDDNSYRSFLDLLISRSSYNFNTDVSVTDNILTLSTCYNSNEKTVVHAKMIKTEKK